MKMDTNDAFNSKYVNAFSRGGLIDLEMAKGFRFIEKSAYSSPLSSLVHVYAVFSVRDSEFDSPLAFEVVIIAKNELSTWGGPTEDVRYRVEVIDSFREYHDAADCMHRIFERDYGDYSYAGDVRSFDFNSREIDGAVNYYLRYGSGSTYSYEPVFQSAVAPIKEVPPEPTAVCVDNTGMEDSFDLGVSYVLVKEDSSQFVHVVDKFGAEKTCLSERFEVKK